MYFRTSEPPGIRDEQWATDHAAFIVAHHGVVAARHSSELSHFKRHIQAIGKRILASSGRRQVLFELNRRGLRWGCMSMTWQYLVRCRWPLPLSWRFPDARVAVELHGTSASPAQQNTAWTTAIVCLQLCQQRKHTSIKFLALNIPEISWVSRSSLVRQSPSMCTRWTMTWHKKKQITTSTIYERLCWSSIYILICNLTSLLSRTSCCGSRATPGASMSSGWTPSSGPCIGRGSRLWKAKTHHNYSRRYNKDTWWDLKVNIQFDNVFNQNTPFYWVNDVIQHNFRHFQQ